MKIQHLGRRWIVATAPASASQQRACANDLSCRRLGACAGCKLAVDSLNALPLLLRFDGRLSFVPTRDFLLLARR
jgi:hypothetical protein